MNKKIGIIILTIITIIILINIGLLGSIIAYNHLTTPHYGDTSYNGVPIRYIPINTTDRSVFGYWDQYGITIYTTGNKTEDHATFYHEIYHVKTTINDDVGAEKYAAEMVPGYIPKDYT